MSPGPVEEGAKVATGFIDAMKREPLSLALVLMNICLLMFFYFLLKTVADQREREVALLYQDHKEVRDLLAKCVIPDRTTFKLQSDESIPVELPPLPRPRPIEEPE